MRPGPPRGATATLSVTVQPEVGRDGDDPGTYTTAPLAADVERVCRQLVEPHLETAEVAVGVRLELLHRAPVPQGEEVTLTATVATVGPTGVTCEVLARHRGVIVARASFEQRVVAAGAFAREVAQRRG